MTKASKVEVFAALLSERAYQDMRKDRDSGAESHTEVEYLLYMKDYLDEAIKVASRTWGPNAKSATLEIIRKVTALGVVCMEENGAPQRTGFPVVVSSLNFTEIKR